MQFFKPNPERMARKQDVEGLLRVAASSDLELQTTAVYHLGLLLGRWFVFNSSYQMLEAERPFNKHSSLVSKHLVSALRSGESRVRSMAATGLSQLSGTKNVDTLYELVSALDDGVAEVRRSAVTSLVFWAIATATSDNILRRIDLWTALTSDNILRLTEDKDDWMHRQAADLLAHIDNQDIAEKAVNDYQSRRGMKPSVRTVMDRISVVAYDRASASQRFNSALDPERKLHPENLDIMSRELLVRYWTYNKAKDLAEDEALAPKEKQFYASLAGHVKDWFDGRPG